MTARARSRRVTSQPFSTGTQETGSSARSGAQRVPADARVAVREVRRGLAGHVADATAVPSPAGAAGGAPPVAGGVISVEQRAEYLPPDFQCPALAEDAPGDLGVCASPGRRCYVTGEEVDVHTADGRGGSRT